MTLQLQEVARAMDAQGSPAPLAVSGWSVDTRTQAPGDVYFALRGPNHDGHDFVAVALERRAAAVVVERSSDAGVELIVRDSLRALQDLGKFARERWGQKVIGVTGSAGK